MFNCLLLVPLVLPIRYISIADPSPEKQNRRWFPYWVSGVSYRS